ncbi:MAG TPA: error-prone DNA polymerase [Rhodanobacteraceae bacterium]|nr:error-prone DNA polymerase [Rhodanobacteraceae bacterium]
MHCLSNFSFQRGASSARELFARARDIGYAALAITDECSLAGIVRAFEASNATGVPLIVGSEVRLEDGPKLVLIAADRDGYSDLCRLITTGRRRGAKGEYRLTRADVETMGDGVLVLWIPGSLFRAAIRGCALHEGKGIAAGAAPAVDRADPRRSAQTRLSEAMHVHHGMAERPDAVRTTEANASRLVPPTGSTGSGDGAWIAQHFPGRAWLAVELHNGPDDQAELAALHALGQRHGLPLVAAGDVHMHMRGRRALQDVLTAIRLGCTVAEAGHALFPNGERHLRRPEGLATHYPPALLAESLRIAARCTFRMDALRYEYPHELVPAGRTAADHLRRLTFKGAARRWPDGMPSAVRVQVERELALIARLEYEHFFLTVEDIVAWARRRNPPILCQGRGSSANSAVCYCLGITAVDPEHGNLLFERFLSIERREPPDIDVDFEHERREEVIQYVFGKYGRARAALAATVIRYRGKSAVRDVGRALGLGADQLDGLSGIFSRVRSGSFAEALRERGFDPASRVMRRLIVLVTELLDFPRHLSQHVGGFVISEHPLHHLVPVENAAMADRTVIQWDKDDLETMRLLKVDCLALGMLTCLRKCFDLVRAHAGRDLDLAGVPQDDPATYAMMRKADTVGVFQIESRAQMSMLPRLKPRTFYDLVVEIAIVRPGPIQGQMVHPYLRRRNGLEPVEYHKPEIEQVLGRTFGVPIFQEQVMRLVEVAAGFTPGEADRLRRAMAAWKRRGGLEPFRERIFAGMAQNGYPPDFAEQIFEQIKGFGDYGFPESHSASFALLAYASAWLKCHHPAAFVCALLNSQPMGFYQPSQLIQDAQRHGVRVLPVDVAASTWDCALEGADASPALRLGLRLVRGLAQGCAERVVEARAVTPFRDVADLVRRAVLNPGERARLADADALRSLSGHRHRARWDSAGSERSTALLADASVRELRVALRPPSLHEEVLTDYATQGLSLKRHPLALVRGMLDRRRILRTRDAVDEGNSGRRLSCAGLVTGRQHPGTAKGVTFVTLEDETGNINVIVWRALAERQTRTLCESTLLGVQGVLETADGVQHLIAHRLFDLSHLLPELAFASRDFR